MDTVDLVERDISRAELARMQAGFEEYQREHLDTGQLSERYTFVATVDGNFIGCASGLRYHAWLYLTDLWLEKEYRQRGLGKRLLEKLERRVAGMGIKHIYTWTAGYEAPGFYRKQGYEVFCELEDYFPNGHSRVGLREVQPTAVFCFANLNVRWSENNREVEAFNLHDYTPTCDRPVALLDKLCDAGFQRPPP